MTKLRSLRLSRGWEPVQLIGHMKIEAAQDGHTLPAVYLMVRLVFLWENHRAALPTYYVHLLDRVYGGQLTYLPTLRGGAA
jgi:hypothetical protein